MSKMSTFQDILMIGRQLFVDEAPAFYEVSQQA
jgi:hypothetical protein